MAQAVRGDVVRQSRGPGRIRDDGPRGLSRQPSALLVQQQCGAPPALQQGRSRPDQIGVDDFLGERPQRHDPLLAALAEESQLGVGLGQCRRGIAKQRWSISDTAEYGDYVSGPRVIDERVKANMKDILTDVQSGAFAQRFIDDQDAGAPEFKRLRAKGEQHPIEATGRELRKLMSWVESDDDYVEGSAGR